MLDRFPGDVLSVIFREIRSPMDYLNASLSCKNVRSYLAEACPDVVVRLYHNTSLGFFQNMTALRSMHITRKYDTFVDLTPLHKARSLHTIYVNNTENLFNAPTTALLLSGNEPLACDQTSEQAINYCASEPCGIDDIDDELMSAKDYFSIRYGMKKYTKTKYKEKTFRMKSRHVAGSV